MNTLSETRIPDLYSKRDDETTLLHTDSVGTVKHFIDHPVVYTCPDYLPVYQVTKIIARVHLH